MRLLTLVAVAAVAFGAYHYSKRRGRGRQRISDRVMAQRVRSAIARAASSPVDVRCVNGIVSLRGMVRRPERDLVLAAALAVPGVTRVSNLLEIDELVGDLGPMQSGMATGV